MSLRPELQSQVTLARTRGVLMGHAGSVPLPEAEQRQILLADPLALRLHHLRQANPRVHLAIIPRLRLHQRRVKFHRGFAHVATE